MRGRRAWWLVALTLLVLVLVADDAPQSTAFASSPIPRMVCAPPPFPCPLRRTLPARTRTWITSIPVIWRGNE